MRHVTIRGILALIWLAAAIVSGVSGNLEWAGLYVLMGAAFGYSAYAARREYLFGSICPMRRRTKQPVFAKKYFKEG